MRKLLVFLLVFLILPFTALFSLSGCQFVSVEWETDDGFDTEEYIPPDYTFNVSATLDKLKITVSGVGNVGEEGTIVALPIYNYLREETAKGLAQDTDSPIVVAPYACGSVAVLTFDRYFDGKEFKLTDDQPDTSAYDAIFYKFYVLSKSERILAGPMYVTEIESLYKYEKPFEPENIKGVMCENEYLTQVQDLNCSYTELNFPLTYHIVPNEYIDEVTGKVVQIEYTEYTDENGDTYITRDGSTPLKVGAIDHNGKRYYFRLKEEGVLGYSIEYIDNLVKKYTDNHVNVVLILYMLAIDSQFLQPYALNYEGLQSTAAGQHVQVNTSTELGAGYWGAFLEFLGERYSRPDHKYGFVTTYVVGNEVDASNKWNQIVPEGQADLNLENYCEEYERQMRIANNSLKKYYKDTQVLISLTHYWKEKGFDYSPKDILDYISIKTLAQGNYDYGYAIHPYGRILREPDFWRIDSTPSYGINGSLNTSCITWSNLEVLQLYLEQQTKLFNGKVRNVYLTEGGVSSSKFGTNTTYDSSARSQAAGVAYIYYKSTQLSCIKALIYYRFLDNDGDGCSFGLMAGGTYENPILKPAYDVYKNIDTENTFDLTYKYLSCIEWVSIADNGSRVPHSTDIDIRSWKDVMAIFESRFDWDTHWDESKIITRK